MNGNEEKNDLLKARRDISFEDVILSLQSGKLLDVISHFNLSKYPNQKLFIITIQNYIYYVPFVEDEEIDLCQLLRPSEVSFSQSLSNSIKLHSIIYTDIGRPSFIGIDKLDFNLPRE